MNMDAINNIANAMASHERNEQNRGKRVNQKGWVTHEDARRNAAQAALGLMILVALLTLLFKLIGFMWRYKIGRIILIGILIFFIVVFISSRTNTQDQEPRSMTKGVRTYEPEPEYVCRFCGQRVYERIQLEGFLCTRAQMIRGEMRNHHVIHVKDYKEPISKMCIKCGLNTKFPELFEDDQCRNGGEHSFFVTKMMEPPDFSNSVRNTSEEYVCAYCGRVTSYKEGALQGFPCEDDGTGERRAHKLVTREEYLNMKMFKCQRCGLKTKFPELRQTEECKTASNAGLHNFKEENGTTSTKETQNDRQGTEGRTDQD